MKIVITTTDNREQHARYTLKDPYFGTAPEALLEGFALMPETEVHVISCTRKPMSSPEKLADNIWFHCLDAPRICWLPTAYQGCARVVRQALKVIKPDIVHGQGTERDCAVTAVFSRLPNVLTIHGNILELTRLFPEAHGLPGLIQGKLENVVLRRTGGVFCNSEYTESLVRPRTARTWRVPNAIREMFFAPAKTDARPKKCILLNIGIICERKRQLELLEMAHKLHEQGLQFEIQFVGNFPNNPYTAKFRERLNIAEAAGYARHLGVKTSEALIERYDAADGMLHFPSEEAFGLVVAEALARGLKFFGPKVGGVTEICDSVADTELLEVNDWEGLSAALTKWMRQGHPKSTNGAEMMRERYHPLVVARRHLEIYREVLNKAV